MNVNNRNKLLCHNIQSSGKHCASTLTVLSTKHQWCKHRICLPSSCQNPKACRFGTRFHSSRAKARYGMIMWRMRLDPGSHNKMRRVLCALFLMEKATVKQQLLFPYKWTKYIIYIWTGFSIQLWFLYFPSLPNFPSMISLQNTFIAFTGKAESWSSHRLSCCPPRHSPNKHPLFSLGLFFVS